MLAVSYEKLIISYEMGMFSYETAGVSQGMTGTSEWFDFQRRDSGAVQVDLIWVRDHGGTI
jgi:hypothetical protein